MNLKMPPDVDPAYAGSWEAFLELPATNGVDPQILYESFRVLLNQAGTKLKTLKATKDWFTVNKLYTEFNRAVTAKFLLYQLKPQRHSFTIEMDADELVNIVKGFKIVGQVKLKAQRFSLDYLISRMVDVKVLGKFPDELKLSERKVLKDGKVTVVKNDRCPAKFTQLKPWNYITLVVNPRYKLSIARLKGDYLALTYEVYVKVDMPYYQNTEKDLEAIWRRATIGDFG